MNKPKKLLTEGKLYFKEILERNFKDVIMISPDLPDYRLIQLADEWLDFKENLPYLELCKLYKLEIKNLPSNNAYISYRNSIVFQPSKFSAFVHEWGHLIDDAFRKEDKLLSSSSDFKSVLGMVRDDQKAYLKRKNINLSTQRHNYLMSSCEIFARSFEYYIWKKGIESSFNKTLKGARKISIESGYQFKPKTINQVVEFFDNFFLNNSLEDSNISKMFGVVK